VTALRQNLVFITGTTRGLGKALQAQFESCGWRVVGLNRPAFDLAALDLDTLDSRFASFPASAHARVVFVNNAASLRIAPANALQPPDITTELTVNVVSPVIAIATFLRHFPRGEIANVTSTAASEPLPNWSLYCTAKAALDGYMRTLAVEGFKVHVLNPGVIDTDMQSVVRGAKFPQVAEYVALKNRGELPSPHAVARRLVKSVIDAT
jgi:NAD(P)-dependent dehydrogenase (short-subunit alcohol dehydrogenase family)